MVWMVPILYKLFRPILNKLPSRGDVKWRCKRFLAGEQQVQMMRVNPEPIRIFERLVNDVCLTCKTEQL